jgi:hypothetical protein
MPWWLLETAMLHVINLLEIFMASTLSAPCVQKHRASLKAQGMRPVQLWVPDTRSAQFATECRRQSALLLADPHERETLDWIERGADTDGWSA